MRLFPPRCIFVGLVLASVTGSAFGAEMREIAPYKWVHPDDD
jgi:hypothetical protein